MLTEVDCNNDVIGLWCKPGIKDTEAVCVLCSTTISCAMHGAAAVKRHTGTKKHLEATAKHRDGSGVLQVPKMVQATTDFSQRRLLASLQDVVKAEAVFAMAVISKSMPYSWADNATEIYKVMFSDSEVAKNLVVAGISCHMSSPMDLDLTSRQRSSLSCVDRLFSILS